MTIPRSPAIAVLDDNAESIEFGLLPLRQVGLTVHEFVDPDDFIAFVLGCSEALVLFVDHDLGLPVHGYDVVRTLRRERPDGLTLPIVYLTGRETEAGFLSTESEDPYAAPSCYLNKRHILKTDLVALVERLANQARGASELADSQSARRALQFFEGLPADRGWEV